jgi:hypothetical protein
MRIIEKIRFIMSGLNSMLDDNASGKKLLGGIFRVTSVCLLYKYFGSDWEDSIYSNLSNSSDSTFANLVSTLFNAGVGIWGVYWVVLGIYKIYTFNMYLDVYEAKLTPFQKRNMKDSVSSTSNIEATMRYRDAKMRTMSQEKAAEFYLSTNRIVNSTTNSSTLGFINSKMAMMSSEQRINYLRGKR